MCILIEYIILYGNFYTIIYVGHYIRRSFLTDPDKYDVWQIKRKVEWVNFWVSVCECVREREREKESRRMHTLCDEIIEMRFLQLDHKGIHCLRDAPMT